MLCNFLLTKVFNCFQFRLLAFTNHVHFSSSLEVCECFRCGLCLLFIVFPPESRENEDRREWKLVLHFQTKYRSRRSLQLSYLVEQRYYRWEKSSYPQQQQQPEQQFFMSTIQLAKANYVKIHWQSIAFATLAAIVLLDIWNCWSPPLSLLREEELLRSGFVLFSQ